MSTKTSIGKINSIPIFSGIADQISIDVTNMMIETLENEIMGQIAKELNTYILREMERHVKELDLDRIANKNDQ